MERRGPRAAGRTLGLMSANEAQPEDLLLGTEVARRVRVESLIHERDGLLTYKATCLRTGRTVVLILPSRGLWEDQEALQRFFRGARAAYGLKHPGIVSVSDVGETSEGIPFLITDLVRGTAVSAMLEDLGRLPLQRLVSIARGVAQGVGAAHKKGVAQWNLAPRSVLVVSLDQGVAQTRLLDLGLTQLLKPKPWPNPNARDSAAADEFRTQPYAAPRAAVAPHVPLDVRAFGGLLFSMATGGSPGEGKVDKQILRSALGEEGEEGTGSERRARQQLADLTLRCLADSPAARPRSMDEIDRKLSRIEDSIGLGLMERSLLDPTSKPTTATATMGEGEDEDRGKDEEADDGVPVEPIHTIEQVKEFVSAGESVGPATGDHKWRTRRVAITAIAVTLFVAGLALGLWINQ
jgi:eukaryotic-like serine/threonine-protein kinase